MSNVSRFAIIHVIDATSFETEEMSFETEEMLHLKLETLGVDIGWEPSGGTLYADLDGILYEWDLRKNKHGPEWWIGEE